MMSVDSPQFAGVHTALKVPPSDLEAVLDDLDGEKETMPEAELNDWELTLEEREGKKLGSASLNNLKESIQNASRGVTEETDKSYRKYVNYDFGNKLSCNWIGRLAENCTTFLVDEGLIKKGDSFVGPCPQKDAPLFIVAWIMNR
jgi:hypothetical protein